MFPISRETACYKESRLTAAPVLETPNSVRVFTPNDPDFVKTLLSQEDGTLDTLSSFLRLRCLGKSLGIAIEGDDADAGAFVLQGLESTFAEKGAVSPEAVMDLVARLGATSPPPALREVRELALEAGRKVVLPKSEGQANYVRSLLSDTVVFGIGPAGTGKTYLAIAAAVQALEAGDVRRIVLSRPAVEAGERLGHLPGDMKEKVDPFMQPLYDALTDFLGGKAMTKMMSDKTIEISPLAYMRGRTLRNAFVILDEAQNATAAQTKMFLTRLGEGSRMVVVGDEGQNDLPKSTMSGLSDAAGRLSKIDGICVCRMDVRDVTRHPLVGKMIEAYETRT